MASNETQPGFFARLKQHHLYRVAVGYGAAIAVLIQVMARAFPYFGWSAAVPAAIIVLIASLPVALVLAWLLVKPTELAAQTTWQRRHWKLGAIITPVVIAAVVVSGIFAFRFSARHEMRVAAEQAAAQAEAKPAAPAFNPPADSIVVLPFANLSDDPKQQYFSNGITEELTNALGQNTGLTVIAWDTASQYAASKLTPKEIGKALNVAHVLAGSIQREGDAVRVTTELINTANGRQLWSAHYDDTLKNIFVVQDKVSAAIATALQVKFAGMRAAPTLNPQAHDLVLKGLALADRFSATSQVEARQDFEQALALDPNYADAYAGLAHVYFNLIQVSTLPLKEALPKVRAAANKALALDPHNVPALVALGNADASEIRIAQARSEFERALALDPSNANAHLDYGNVLPVKQAISQTQEALLLDPRNAFALSGLSDYFLDIHDYPDAMAAAQSRIKLSPQDIDAAFYLAFIYQQLHRDRDVLSAFDQVKPGTPLDQQLVDAGQLTYQSLANSALRPQALVALEKLRRVGLNPIVQADLIQLYLALDEKESAIQLLQENCSAAPINCNDLAINFMYAPLHGDPRFEKLAKQYTTITLGTAPASAASH